ncbi:MAG: hypothetical protein ACREAE_07525, partial [Nitrosopumilaceae archaeon]
MSGLIVDFKSSSQINKEEVDAAYKAEKEANNEYSENFETQLAGYIRKVWETNRLAKQEVHKRLLACLRARKGEYSDSERQQILAMGGADPIFIKLTGTKCRAAAAWIRDILLPHKDRPWELEPTPIPDLPENIKESVLRQVMSQIQEMVQQGMQLSPDEQIQFVDSVKEKVLSQMSIAADVGVKFVERKIEDAMAEGNYKKAMEEFVEDFVTYPFAIIKGPYYQTKSFLKWEGGKAVPTTENVLCWRRVSPFDIYYAPYSSNLQEGDLVEHIRYSRNQIYDLIGKEGYNDEEIRRVLQKHGSLGLQDWIWENFEREKLESNSGFFLKDSDTIDALHYWGYVSGEVLLDWGYDAKEVDDPIKMYPVDAILIDRCVIRAVINKNPLGHRPYHSACWDAIPGSLIGVALSEQMEDHQKMVNATARALATNMAIGAGPQVAILTDMIANGEDITNIYPLKIWQMKSSLTGNSGKPIEFFQPEIKSHELLGVLNAFESKADDVTNVPRYSYGNEKIGGAGSTATGLSMLMNSAAKGIRRAIANIDLNVTQPTVYQTFVEILMKNTDPSFHADAKVVAKGSAAILIKEQMHENFKEFLQITTNDLDIGIMGKRGRAKLLTSIADNLGIDPLVLPSDQELEFEEKQQKAIEQQQAQAEIAAQQAQTAGPGAELQQAAAEVQQAAAEVEQQTMQVEQQAQQVEQAEKAVEAKDKIVQKQASEVDGEMKKLKQVQKQIEDAAARLALDKIEAETVHAAQMADLEKMKISIEIEKEKLKALEMKVKVAAMTKEQVEEELKTEEIRFKEKKKRDDEAIKTK